MSLFSEPPTHSFPRTPIEVREALEGANYSQERAAEVLSVEAEALWEFINGPLYMRYMREAAHVTLLQVLKTSSEETPKNIRALCDIRDTSEKGRDRIMAVKALEDIFSSFELPPAPAGLELLADREERRQAAFALVSAAINRAGPPPSQ